MEIKLTLTATPELLSTLNRIAEALVPKSLQINKEPQHNTRVVAQPVQQMQRPIQPIQPAQIPAQNMQSVIPTTPQAQAPTQPVQQPVPVTTQNYTMDQLAVAATQLIDSGHRIDLVNLLTSFGVQALTALPKEQYGAFATQLRSMGAKI